MKPADQLKALALAVCAVIVMIGVITVASMQVPAAVASHGGGHGEGHGDESHAAAGHDEHKTDTHDEHKTEESHKGGGH